VCVSLLIIEQESEGHAAQRVEEPSFEIEM